MQLEYLSEILQLEMKIQRGSVVALSGNGEIIIENESEGHITCDFLRTSAAPQPVLHPGDRVLYVADELGQRGYVLGVVQKYTPPEENRHGSSRSQESAEQEPQIQIHAKERIEIRCGKSSLTMRQDGNVIIKGTTIVSRARRVNKIKGAAVQIN